MTEPSTGDGVPGDDERRRIVRERYAGIARETDTGGQESAACCSDSDADGSACCGDGNAATSSEKRKGYSSADLDAVTDGANLGLGCGNPKALADLSPGETVLDLGSGAGFDCFLAAREVGPDGHVIGVDMTPGMVERARENARENDAANVEFRLGEIEHLPVGDERVDVVISNCVVNLSPDKPRVFAEAFRVLEPGGRLAISDVVETAPLPDEVRADPDSLSACVSGAATIETLEAMLADAGFEGVEIEPKDESATFIREWDGERDLSEYVVSATIEGRKPIVGSSG